MSTRISEDRVILESLDFDPACEKSNHTSEEPATWAAIYAPRAACGCPTPGVMLWCEPCRARWVSAGRIWCNHCGSDDPSQRLTIVRFEPLS